jgi:hypothetical protein
MEIRRCFLRGCAALALLYAGCTSPEAQPKTSGTHSDPVRILAFYPRDAVVTEGGITLLCYGVSNAKSVRVEPPVDGVSPSLTRCVEIRPRGETHYTLTAVGSDGQTVSETATVRIGTDTAALPKISSFKIDGTQKDYAGKTVFSLSFAAQNADEVSISPAVFPALHGAPSGQFSVKPDKTTTYILSAKGKNGHTVQKQLTVEVGR